MTIKFSDDATTATMGAIIDALAGWTLKVEYAEGVTGFPEDCAVYRAQTSGIVICDVNEVGAPIESSLYHVGYDEIQSITIV
jgi:hypothetical protein